jgi:hypothetical protein
MPKGPNGQKRPADAIGLAVMVGRIATGEIEENLSQPRDRATIASIGGRARAKALSAERRAEIASNAARARKGHPEPSEEGSS